MKGLLIVVIATVMSIATRGDEGIDEDRKIRGQQLIEQTMTAKLVGAEGFSEQFLNLPTMKLDNNQGAFNFDNFSLVYGGNGSIPQLVTENRKTTVTRVSIPLSVSYMDSPFYKETLNKFVLKNNLYFKNTTLNTTGNMDIDLLMLKLWASATLRDNIVTVFGYLLFRQPPILPGDMHSALSQLYNRFRLRRINTIDLLAVLQDLSFESPQKQFILFFEELDKVVPKYLKSSVTYWLENLHLKTIDLNDILRPNNGALVVDLLSGIDSNALETIKKPMYVKQSYTKSPKFVDEIMGSIFNNIIAGIATGTIPLTQQLLATLLLHLPLNRMCPQGDENERYVIDLLRKGKMDEDNFFAEVSDKLNLKEMFDPYELVKSALQLSLTTSLSKSRLNTILLCLENPLQTYTLPTYNAMSKIYMNDKINVQLLLQTLVAGEYPDDVIDAKERLLYYINKNYIDFDFVLRGFIKYDHHSPFDLIIALLTRIELRSSNLPNEVITSINTIKSHMIFKKSYNNLKTVFPEMDMSTLLSTFLTPNIPEDVKFIVTEIKALTEKELVVMPNSLQYENFGLCTRPRQCVVNILKAVVESKIKNDMILTKVKKFLTMVDENGEPQSKKTVKIDCSPHPPFDPKLTRYRFEKFERSNSGPMPEIYVNPEPRLPQIYPGKDQTSPYLDTDTTKSLYRHPIYIGAFYNISESCVFDSAGNVLYNPNPNIEVSSITSRKIPLPHPGEANMPFEKLTDLLPKVVPGSDDDIKLLPIKILLLEKDLLETLDINLSDYPTKGTLLLTILKKSINYDSLFRDPSQKIYVDNYAKLLDFVYKILPPPPPTGAKDSPQTIDFGALLQAIPTPTDEVSLNKYEYLKSFMLQSNFSNLLVDFDIKRYQTKGLLLKNILQYLLTNDFIKDINLLDAIRYFEKKVHMNGFGAQAVEWTIIVHKITTKTVDLNDVFSILDTRKMTKEEKKSLITLYDFLMSEFSPTIHMRGFDSMGFKTKGEFLTAFLDHLQSLYISESIRQAISDIEPYVLMSPDSDQPIHYYSS